MNIRRFFLCALVVGLVSIPGGGALANGKKPVPKPLTMEEKVKGSDLIFIGEATRVFLRMTAAESLREIQRILCTWVRG